MMALSSFAGFRNNRLETDNACQCELRIEQQHSLDSSVLYHHQKLFSVCFLYGTSYRLFDTMKTHSTISTFHLVAVRACKSTSNLFNLFFIHRLSAASTCSVLVRLKISLFMEMKSNVFSVHESSNDYLIKRLYVRKVCCIQIKKMLSFTTAMEVFAPMIP